MASVIVTMKIMPESPEVDLEKISEKANHLIKEFGGSDAKKEFTPVAFGLKAINLTFSMDENLGSPDELENQISEVEQVKSAEVSDVRRAIG